MRPTCEGSGSGRHGVGTLELSVVIPALNEAPALPALLARLMRSPDQLGPDQAGPDRADEIIVVDGGSVDGTPEVAVAAGVRLVSAGRSGRGRGAQQARGAAEARGELLLFLHADCLPAPGALAALRAAYADEPRLVASAMRQRIDTAGWFFRSVERAANARSGRGVVMGDAGLAVRRSIYEAAGGFRPLRLFEDVELSRRLRALGNVARIDAAALHVSPRRWEHEGALRCTLRNWMLRGMFRAGVDPARLARLYPPNSACGDPS